jgi:hypothetical protein
MSDIKIYEYDIFLSHASEDKDFATPLYEALSKEYGVWYDENNIKWGDDLKGAINYGLQNSKYGLVILSENYLRKDKQWTWEELKVILERDNILPILHGITIQDIPSNSTLAKAILEKLAISSKRTNVKLSIEDIIEKVKKAIGEGSLCSERNIDYTKLRNLLSSYLRSGQYEKRKLAAKETCEVIIQAIQSSGDNHWGENTDFNTLWGKDTDLMTINRLWLKYTNGYFRKEEDTSIVTRLVSESIILRKCISEQIIPNIDEIAVTGDLASEKNLDYTELREYLKAKKFAAADKETARNILYLTNREKSSLIKDKDLDKIPCKDIRTIDQLWLSASKGNFGFSVQKEIWIKICEGGDFQNERTWKQFINRVEWNPNFEITFGENGNRGHLPLGLYIKTETTDCRFRSKWDGLTDLALKEYKIQTDKEQKERENKIIEFQIKWSKIKKENELECEFEKKIFNKESNQEMIKSRKENLDSLIYEKITVMITKIELIYEYRSVILTNNLLTENFIDETNSSIRFPQLMTNFVKRLLDICDSNEYNLKEEMIEESLKNLDLKLKLIKDNYYQSDIRKFCWEYIPNFIDLLNSEFLWGESNTYCPSFLSKFTLKINTPGWRGRVEEYTWWRDVGFLEERRVDCLQVVGVRRGIAIDRYISFLSREDL